MNIFRNSLLFAISFYLTAGNVYADVSDKLSMLEGYTIVLATYIKGSQDRDGKRDDAFTGCNFDRIIIFDNGKVLTCATYNYTYSYHPSAIIFSNGSSYKMLVGNDLYDMRR